ncbi:glycosyltransferase family 2 protein [Polynucleobacter sp. AP-Nino-20-G2]|uniref:glycosyltransferase family 2 protein n=1 Tax=Polynucleobacter sp. AP-Nino-20-G2 TaxID=2576917 RepID=UPI001BFD1561|nr:glycosyltransferase family 2 protein [Polynucleobacter sp. AP-Nino-20-G2]QWE16960.1 glycosyltransferase family 2 protein [Polynucleobacter sp. AP-Nino-20-G2]
MNLAPIVLFVYKRLDHTKKIIESLLENEESRNSTLVIYADGPKSDSDVFEVRKVRAFCKSISGFKSVDLIERSENYGLASSIISGVTEVLTTQNKAIILEDDILVSPFFLKYMNEALELYKDDPIVAAINGYSLPVGTKLPEVFFLKGADCWGWATWRRAWSLFNPDGASLLSEINSRGLKHEFNLGGYYPYVKMLENQVMGRNQSWAIRWQASVFLRGMMTLYPGHSLVRNIGNDNSGVHCNATSDFDVQLSCRSIEVNRVPIIESIQALDAVKLFYKKTRWFPRRLARYIFNQIANFFLKIYSGLKNHE